MKCKDCTMDCPYRTSDGEKECELQNHIIQLPDEWQGVRIQAAIAAMQGIISHEGYTTDRLMKGFTRKQQIEAAVNYANLLVEELKKK